MVGLNLVGRMVDGESDDGDGYDGCGRWWKIWVWRRIREGRGGGR